MNRVLAYMKHSPVKFLVTHHRSNSSSQVSHCSEAVMFTSLTVILTAFWKSILKCHSIYPMRSVTSLLPRVDKHRHKIFVGNPSLSRKHLHQCLIRQNHLSPIKEYSDIFPIGVVYPSASHAYG